MCSFFAAFARTAFTGESEQSMHHFWYVVIHNLLFRANRLSNGIYIYHVEVNPVPVALKQALTSAFHGDQPGR